MSALQDEIKAFVEFLVKSLVDEPEEVSVVVSVSTKVILVQIKTAKHEIGKVVGKQGRTVDALKVITLAVKNTKFQGDSKSISIEILEDETYNFKKKDY